MFRQDHTGGSANATPILATEIHGDTGVTQDAVISFPIVIDATEQCVYNVECACSGQKDEERVETVA